MAEKLKKLDENKKNARIVEEKWEEFKSIIISLEDWIKNIDKNQGEKQFTYLNQMIKNNDEIIVALQTKKKHGKIMKVVKVQIANKENGIILNGQRTEPKNY